MALTKVKAGNILLTTPSASSNDVTPATTQYVTTAIGNLIDTAPSTLNTLNELAAALGDDVNFSTTVTNSIATKLPLAGGTMTGALTVNGDANPALEISRGSANTTNVNLKYNTTLTGQISAANEKFQISAAGSGTEMEFYVNGEKRLEIDTSGNVGIGLTPTNFANRKSLDIGSAGKIWGHTSATETGMGSNFYFDGAYKRTSANAATRHIQDGNGHTFDVAASGSADATISWTTAMTIDSAGNVGIGTTSPDRALEVSTDGTAQLRLSRVDTTINGNNTIGSIEFMGTDDTAGTVGATIVAASSTTWGGGNYPTDLRFSTMSGSTLSEVARFTTDRVLQINATKNYGSGTTFPSYTALGGHIHGYVNGSGSTYPRYLDIASIGQGDGSKGGEIRFLTSPNGSTTGVERVRINQAGNVLFSAPAAGTNKEITINGHNSKATRIKFAEAGVDKWLIGNGAASENGNFEIYASSGKNFTIAPATGAVTTSGPLSADSNATVIDTDVAGGNFVAGCAADTFHEITNIDWNGYFTDHKYAYFMVRLFWTSGVVAGGYNHRVTIMSPNHSSNATTAYAGVGSYTTSHTGYGTGDGRLTPLIMASHHTGVTAIDGFKIDVKFDNVTAYNAPLYMHVKTNRPPAANTGAVKIQVWRF